MTIRQIDRSPPEDLTALETMKTPDPDPPIDRNSSAYHEAFEVVDGRLTEWPNKGAHGEVVRSVLLMHLGVFVRRQGLGRALGPARYRINPRLERRPDVSYLSTERWPLSRRIPNDPDWPVLPDLAAEVVGWEDPAWDVIAKVREYFDAGVRAVWLVYPHVEVVHVYHAWDRVEVGTRAGTLDGGAVVPGFRLPLVELFEGEETPEAPAEPTAGAGPAA